MKTGLQWWESKRKWYALAVLVTLIICEVINYMNQPLSVVDQAWYVFSIPGVLVSGLVWIFGANVFYTLGYGTEVVLDYYLKTDVSSVFRKVAFVLGTGFSVLWTVMNILRC